MREAIKIVEADGWRLMRWSGSHRQFKHPRKPGKVTIPGKAADELHPKTKRSILQQAGLR